MKTKKCLGCGVLLQDKDPLFDGYAHDHEYCKRCFRMKNYNEFSPTTKTNLNYVEILKNIEKDDLVLYVVDIFNLNFDIDMIFSHFDNNVILVLTKSDILPRSVKEYKLLNYFSDKFLDKILISSNKNWNLDALYEMILKHKKTKNIYVVGKTNSGKSTLINKLIKNYSDIKYDLTTSYYPSTTLDEVIIDINDNVRIIDTPGLIDETDIINYVTPKEIKMITPKKEIKPITFQIEGERSIIVEPYLRVDTNDYTSFTFYVSNNIEPKINSFKNEKLIDLKRHEFDVLGGQDIVINGLLWIKVTNRCSVVLYTYSDVLVYLRDNII